MSTRGPDCDDCPFRVEASDVLPGDLCSWSATPSVLRVPGPGVQTRPCALRHVSPLKGGGRRKSRDWVRNGRNLTELFGLFFRGVRMDQVCLRCEGTGLDPEKDSSTPLWIRACDSCHGRGFLGNRDESKVIPFKVVPLRPPRRFEDGQRRTTEDEPMDQVG